MARTGGLALGEIANTAKIEEIRTEILKVTKVQHDQIVAINALSTSLGTVTTLTNNLEIQHEMPKDAVKTMCENQEKMNEKKSMHNEPSGINRLPAYHYNTSWTKQLEKLHKFAEREQQDVLTSLPRSHRTIRMPARDTGDELTTDFYRKQSYCTEEMVTPRTLATQQ